MTYMENTNIICYYFALFIYFIYFIFIKISFIYILRKVSHEQPCGYYIPPYYHLHYFL